MRSISFYTFVFFYSFSFVSPACCFAKQENLKKQNAKAFQEEFHQLVENQNFIKASQLIAKELQKKNSTKFLERVVKKEDAPPIANAFYAAKSINQLGDQTGLSKAEALRIALFIETRLPKMVQKNKFYISRKSTNLARTIEYDPETKKTFIHLKQHGGLDRIGKGSKKMVTKSILYDKKRPEIVANCTTFKAIPLEVTTSKALQGVKGLVEMRAITERKGRNNTPIYSFFCKYYKEGTILHVIKNHKLSLKKRIALSHDILTGLAGMHTRGYVHRDLGLANYLADSKKKGTTKGLHAVIADLGRSMKAEDAIGKNTQGHRKYIPPEGLIWRRTKNFDYYASDVYAVGCLLYRFFYQKNAPWLDLEIVKDTTLSAKERYKKYLPRLAEYYKKESHTLRKKIAKNKRDTRARMKVLTMQLVHPDLAKRPSAEVALKRCQAILKAAR